MNLTCIRIDLARQLRDVSILMFVVALPAAMVLLFGQLSSSDTQAGNGNVGYYITVSMAAYSAATAATAIAGTAVAESLAGWSRQLSLAGQSIASSVLNKTVVAILASLITTALVFAVGALNGAEADSWQLWVQSYLIVLAGMPLFASYGFAVAMWFKTENAAGLASALITFFAFFGNVFLPLSGWLLTIARFTPMYGYVALARYPLLEGNVLDGDTLVQEEPWLLWANVGAWFAVFFVAAVLGARRARSRR